MATITVIEETPVPPPKRYVLELSEKEARAVRVLVGGVYGDGALREAATAIWNALLPFAPELASNDFCASTTVRTNRYVETGE